MAAINFPALHLQDSRKQTAWLAWEWAGVSFVEALPSPDAFPESG
jgi:hypothetical protein